MKIPTVLIFVLGSVMLCLTAARCPFAHNPRHAELSNHHHGLPLTFNEAALQRVDWKVGVVLDLGLNWPFEALTRFHVLSPSQLLLSLALSPAVQH